MFAVSSRPRFLNPREKQVSDFRGFEEVAFELLFQNRDMAIPKADLRRQN